MDRRLFGPKSLRYLRKELAHVKSSETESQHRNELERLQAEREKIDQSMRRQTLRMEEQDDPVTRSSCWPSSESTAWRALSGR
jgi:hypothetical protein